MKTPPVAALLLAACALPGSTADPQSLAAAESAFAAHSVRTDMRAAFLAAFAPDGVLVREGWKTASESLASRTAPPIVLDWRPVHVEVAASAEMGLSTGPWRITARGASQARDFGQFVSIWTRAPGGPWRVAVDIGISHPGAALWDEPLQARVSPGTPASSPLDAAEAAFSRTAAQAGMRSAWADWGASDLRVYRDGAAPALGREAALRTAFEETHRLFVVERTATAASADFGWARGWYAAASAPERVEGYYLHAWRHEPAGWRLVADVVNPKR